MACLHLSPCKTGGFGRRLFRLGSSVLVPAVLSGVLGGAIALSPLVLTPVAQAQRAPSDLIINRVLRRGDRGPDVLQLQQELVRRKFLDIRIPNGQRDGYFGPETEAALRVFQRSVPGLVADGIMGEQTFRQLFGLGLVPTQTFSIAVMQAQLSELGYFGSGLDGRFGPATAQALQNFRDETFTRVSLRQGDLEDTFGVVDGYYNDRRIKINLPHRNILEERVRLRLPESDLFTYGRILGSTNTGGGGRPPAVSSRNGRPFIVMVPVNNNAALLSQLRSIRSDAFRRSHPLGDYVQVAAYDDQGNAEAFSNELRRRGFDARVIFD